MNGTPNRPFRQVHHLGIMEACQGARLVGWPSIERGRRSRVPLAGIVEELWNRGRFRMKRASKAVLGMLFSESRLVTIPVGEDAPPVRCDDPRKDYGYPN